MWIRSWPPTLHSHHVNSTVYYCHTFSASSVCSHRPQGHINTQRRKIGIFFSQCSDSANCACYLWCRDSGKSSWKKTLQANKQSFYINQKIHFLWSSENAWLLKFGWISILGCSQRVSWSKRLQRRGQLYNWESFGPKCIYLSRQIAGELINGRRTLSNNDCKSPKGHVRWNKAKNLTCFKYSPAPFRIPVHLCTNSSTLAIFRSLSLELLLWSLVCPPFC